MIPNHPKGSGVVPEDVLPQSIAESHGPPGVVPPRPGFVDPNPFESECLGSLGLLNTLSSPGPTATSTDPTRLLQQAQTQLLSSSPRRLHLFIVILHTIGGYTLGYHWCRDNVVKPTPASSVALLPLPSSTDQHRRRRRCLLQCQPHTSPFQRVVCGHQLRCDITAGSGLARPLLVHAACAISALS
ncbi:hypothetical protein CsSME_00011915 [Camellia sinensis var. sinensis]